MLGANSSRARSVCGLIGALVLGAGPFIAGTARGESLESLRDQMDEVQGRLDRATERLETLRDRAGEIDARLEETLARRDVVRARHRALERRAVARAVALYRAPETGVLELFLGSSSIFELANGAEMLARVAERDDRIFTQLARTRDELIALSEALRSDRAELRRTLQRVRAAAQELQERFARVSDDYKALKRKIEARARAREMSSSALPSAVAAAPAPVTSGSGLVCPVAGAVSFVDSWGAPRDGHTHQGVDMMAAYGTPIVAVTSGVITLSSYDGSAGNWLILSGSDGNSYWYMHNRDNLVGGGAVAAGQQIASLGDTGNAAGTPHLHFEYHPGGGAAVNPYPLVASIC